MIAVLATLGTLFAFLGNAAFNDAALFKTNAALAKTSAANAWNHYQAKSTRQHMAELAATLPGTDQERYRDEAARYADEKETIRRQAERHEAASNDWNAKSDAALERQRYWSSATVAQQIAISLAAVTLLTRRTWLLAATGAVAAFGLALGLVAILNEPVLPLALVALLVVLCVAALIAAARQLWQRFGRSGAPRAGNLE